MLRLSNITHVEKELLYVEYPHWMLENDYGWVKKYHSTYATACSSYVESWGLKDESALTEIPMYMILALAEKYKGQQPADVFVDSTMNDNLTISPPVPNANLPGVNSYTGRSKRELSVRILRMTDDEVLAEINDAPFDMCNLYPGIVFNLRPHLMLKMNRTWCIKYVPSYVAKIKPEYMAKHRSEFMQEFDPKFMAEYNERQS